MVRLSADGARTAQLRDEMQMVQQRLEGARTHSCATIGDVEIAGRSTKSPTDLGSRHEIGEVSLHRTAMSRSPTSPHTPDGPATTCSPAIPSIGDVEIAARSTESPTDLGSRHEIAEVSLHRTAMSRSPTSPHTPDGPATTFSPAIPSIGHVEIAHTPAHTQAARRPPAPQPSHRSAMSRSPPDRRKAPPISGHDTKSARYPCIGRRCRDRPHPPLTRAARRPPARQVSLHRTAMSRSPASPPSVSPPEPSSNA